MNIPRRMRGRGQIFTGSQEFAPWFSGVTCSSARSCRIGGIWPCSWHSGPVERARGVQVQRRQLPQLVTGCSWLLRACLGEGHKDIITAVAMVPKGEQDEDSVVTVGWDARILVWAKNTMQLGAKMSATVLRKVTKDLNSQGAMEDGTWDRFKWSTEVTHQTYHIQHIIIMYAARQ